MSGSVHKAPPGPPNNPYNDTLETLWKRAKQKLHLGSKQGSSGDNHEDSEEEEETGEPCNDPGKSAHSKRREQVRRAQRNHRQRKEKYIKTLERELLRLRDEATSVQIETYQVAEENSILRDIMLAHGIPFPLKGASMGAADQWLFSNPMATVSVVGSPGFGQRLQVSVSDVPGQLADVFPPGFGVPDSPTAEHPIISIVSNAKGIPPPQESAQPNITPPRDLNGAGLLPHSAEKLSHPYGLDATQVGVDFVLFMERCCLPHTHQPHDTDEPTGHALTVQAPLLTTAPPVLDDRTAWQVPAKELDRLFELSSALKIDGELVPVQAWMRIRQHPLFHKLDPAGLRRLSETLITGVRCFGFGATLEEEFFTMTMNEVFGSL
ncbi:hypothetical protein AJ79_01026 [Helicocarpus griseus UAMH5409]|uniref:BZIP domain-containing protein n=1 Tax=Helicocarpus griseus UAMH5409 TaxID=1447875 RepID=A0A2B7Y0S3_9EURO|nr:hypothetical protein AJ79_01026 [Helicocarpus griseus UAMH5409]